MRVIAAIGLAISASATAAVAGAQAPAGSIPTITLSSPRQGASYARHARILARYRCSEDGRPVPTCRGTVPAGHAVNTSSAGIRTFTVSATDATGNTVSRTVSYTVWTYVDPLREVTNLQPSRIDMGVDYSGAGPVLAIGRAKVVLATDRLAGPESCWGKTCVPPPGDIIVYRLLDGPFAGKFVYVVEHITIKVRAGQIVAPGQTVAILHQGSPNLELGWAAGRGAATLAAARGDQCACTDPGGWSSIEGRNFNALLVSLAAPSGYLTIVPAGQRMPPRWPRTIR